ncbi:putative lipoprotein [Leptospira interrogans str. 2003000735]|uniref:Putative lipoprotein n=2 Tax=Leptospira interrogans TaxID=173 RepID=A0A829D9T1_LEPIR|nr:hypothetical protein [Leptospira interrogans]EMY05171.1 putative lipoprotein [Leptospira interrogans str. 2002000626]EMY26141.1 putative lipoprotein [Leptospira interrogans serovar Australis str. 200703203]EKN89481.1 putative lipoprotein [Leptospira interrogans str. 2002000624]EKQ38763.1 putative lipoprotein [Leptospira interrogans str. 2002000621]EKQ45428.1 putative lipoprotein [Leptospira interrogans str. 2002000623]
MKFSVSIFLSVSILFQTLVFSSGLFGCFLSEQYKLCECNHGSKIQKHINKEDVLFAKKIRSFNRSTTSKKLPDCHSAQSGETHSCSCKKSENKLSQLGAFYSTFFSQKQASYIRHDLDIIQIITLEYSNFGISSFSFLFRPPRIS